MTPESRTRLRQDVMRAEGCRLTPYRDTVGKLTVGYGRNLDDVGITALEAEVLLDHDLATAELACKAWPWFRDLNDARQRVIVEMVFNLGLAGVRGFAQMLRAIADRDYAAAAREMRDSKWATQVKGRAVRLARVMHDGYDTVATETRRT